jgi:CBS domain-containing protein
VVAGLIYGPLVQKFAPEARGHGVPEVMYAVAERGGRIPAQVSAVKALASALTIGSGGSVGREGPIVQYTIILPMLTAIVIATATSRALGKDTIYTLKLRRCGVDLDRSPGARRLAGTRVETVAEALPEPLAADLPMERAAHALAVSGHGILPVVGADGRYQGCVTARAVAEALADQHEGLVGDLAELPPLVTGGSSLADALTALTNAPGTGPPVLAGEGRPAEWLGHPPGRAHRPRTGHRSLGRARTRGLGVEWFWLHTGIPGRGAVPAGRTRQAQTASAAVPAGGSPPASANAARTSTRPCRACSGILATILAISRRRRLVTSRTTRAPSAVGSITISRREAGLSCRATSPAVTSRSTMRLAVEGVTPSNSASAACFIGPRECRITSSRN